MTDKLTKAVQELDRRQALLWGDLSRLQSGCCADPEGTLCERIERERRGLERVFEVVRGLLARSKSSFLLLLAYLLICQNGFAADGMLSSAIDFTGDVLALPFRVLAGVFQAAF